MSVLENKIGNIAKVMAVFTACSALSAPSFANTVVIDELNFDNNATPSGWSFSDVSGKGGHNTGIANGVFYAASVDSAATLYHAYTAATNATELHIAWQANVFNTLWGNFQYIQFDDASGGFRSFGSWAKDYYFESGVRFFITDLGQNWEDKYGYTFLHGNYSHGNYDFEAILKDGEISLKGSLDGAQIFSLEKQIPNFKLANQTGIRIGVAETTGPLQWVDNVSITEVRTPVAAVPEPSAAWLAVAGMFGLATMRLLKKRRGN